MHGCGPQHCALCTSAREERERGPYTKCTTMSFQQGAKVQQLAGVRPVLHALQPAQHVLHCECLVVMREQRWQPRNTLDALIDAVLRVPPPQTPFPAIHFSAHHSDPHFRDTTTFHQHLVHQGPCCINAHLGASMRLAGNIGLMWYIRDLQMYLPIKRLLRDSRAAPYLLEFFRFKPRMPAAPEPCNRQRSYHVGRLCYGTGNLVR